MTSENGHILRDNIRMLVGRFPSISAASKELEINRQQLNKYLSGTSVPSVRILTLFSEYFTISVKSLISEPVANSVHFRAVGADNENKHHALKTLVKKRLHEAIISKNSLREYCGTYYRISTMPTMEDKIIRALTIIYQRNELTYATTLEVFDSEYDLKSHKKFIRRSHSIITEFADRLYFFDQNQEKRFMSMILYPSTIPVFKYLSGFAMSVSDYGSRKIFCIPFLLQRLSKRPATKSILRSCGIFDRDGPEIDDEIRIRLATLT